MSAGRHPRIRSRVETFTHARALTHTQMHTHAHGNKPQKPIQARATLATDGVEPAMLAMRFRSMRRCGPIKVNTENLFGQQRARERGEHVLEELPRCGSAEKTLNHSELLSADKVSKTHL